MDSAQMNDDGPRRRVRRLATRVASVAAGLLVLWLTACYFLVFHPPQEPLPAAHSQADAVVVLAGASEERLPKGRELVREGHAPLLALSTTGTPGNAATDRLCRTVAADEAGSILCFSPDQRSTRGEAREVARIAAQRNWDTVIVVTSKYHVRRALTNFNQCSAVQFISAASTPELDVFEWLGRFVEESVALTASAIRPACASPLN